MKKFFKGLDKAARKLDTNLSKAIGLEDGAKISHAFNPDSIHHKSAVNQLKGKEVTSTTTQSATTDIPTPPSYVTDDTPSVLSSSNYQEASSLAPVNIIPPIVEPAPAEPNHQLTQAAINMQASAMPTEDHKSQEETSTEATTASSTLTQTTEQDPLVKELAEIFDKIKKHDNSWSTTLLKYNTDYLKSLYDAIDHYPIQTDLDAIMELSGALENILGPDL